MESFCHLHALIIDYYKNTGEWYYLQNQISNPFTEIKQKIFQNIDFFDFGANFHLKFKKPMRRAVRGAKFTAGQKMKWYIFMKFKADRRRELQMTPLMHRGAKKLCNPI